jgi:hypothetical protein
MGKLDFGSQPRASKRDKFLDLSEFANFPWVTHFGPQLPQNQSLKRHYGRYRERKAAPQRLRAMIVSEIGWPEQLPQFGDFLGGLSSSAQKASHCSTDKTK